jgi:hypothetical protein
MVYCHGWGTEIAVQYPMGDYGADGTIWYGLDEQLDNSKRNVILIAPQLAKKANSGRPGKLARPQAAAALLAEARDAVDGRLSGGRDFRSGFDAAPVIVASYSGGYQAAACFVALDSGMAKRVKAVFMLDSLYGKASVFEDWITASRGSSVFVSLARDTGKDRDNTWLVTQDLLQRLGKDASGISGDPPAQLLIGETTAYRPANVDHYKVSVAGPPAGPLTWFLDTLPALPSIASLPIG